MGRFRPGRALCASFTTLALVGAAVAWAAPAEAATVCNPQQKKFYLYEASVPWSLGTMTLNTNICMDGTKLSSSTASMTWSASPAGMAAGWRFDNNATQRIEVGTANAAWVSSATLKLCVPTQISPLCSYGESFKITYYAYSKTFVGPQRGPVFACTNSYCRLSI
jgi:hypothetical protein